MDNITGRSTARRLHRAGKQRTEEEADLSQVLRMTPTRGSRETLATATALQRARAAALRKDREATLVTEQRKRERVRPSVLAALTSSALKFESNPPVVWTPENPIETDTDTDDESTDDESNDDEKTYDEEKHADNEDAAAIAAAEDAEDSEIQTPVNERYLAPTQSDLDFIVTDDEEEGLYLDEEEEYFPSTAEDNDEEEEAC